MCTCVCSCYNTYNNKFEPQFICFLIWISSINTRGLFTYAHQTHLVSALLEYLVVTFQVGGHVFMHGSCTVHVYLRYFCMYTHSCIHVYIRYFHGNCCVCDRCTRSSLQRFCLYIPVSSFVKTSSPQLLICPFPCLFPCPTLHCSTAEWGQ